jgi:tetratricopeptide (TPR) repeat protein
MRLLKKLIIVAIVFIGQFIYATGGNETTAEANWGTNPTEAKGYWLRLTQLANQKDYATAYQPCSWLLSNAPELNVDLYKIAAKVYKSKLKTEKTPIVRAGLKDTILFIYDKHISDFNGGARVLNKKGKVAWLYQGRSSANHDELYKLYTDIYTQNGTKTYNSNIYFYFVTAARQYRKGNMTATDLLGLYDELTSDLSNRADAVEVSKKADVTKYLDKIDVELNKFVNVDCDFVMAHYGPNFNTTPNVALAHKIQDKLNKNKCVDNDLYINTTNYLIENEGPTYANVKTLGNIYLSQGQNDLAYTKYEEALALTQDATAKGNLFMKLAKLNRKSGKLSKARSNILSAINVDPSLSSTGHNTIAGMYLATAPHLSTGDPIQDRLVYIAAYEEYKLAGNASKMTETKAQFPSMEEIFVRNLQLGDSMTIKSWINLNVSLQKRD